MKLRFGWGKKIGSRKACPFFICLLRCSTYRVLRDKSNLAGANFHCPRALLGAFNQNETLLF
jgi:hypothetical protein